MIKTFLISFFVSALFFPVYKTFAETTLDKVELQTAPDGKVNKELDELNQAIHKGDLNFLRSYLQKGGNIDRKWAKTKFTVSLSMWQRALWGNRPEIFQFLIDQGAFVDKSDSNSKLALLIALENSHVQVVDTLLKKGLQLNEVDLKRAFVRAVKSKKLSTVQFVMQKMGVKIDRNSPEIDMHYVTDEMMRYWVPKYIHPNAKAYLPMSCEAGIFFKPKAPNEGCDPEPTPLLMEYVFRGNQMMVQYFLDNGADLKTKGIVNWSTGDRHEYSAIGLARAKKDEAMVRFLNAHGFGK